MLPSKEELEKLFSYKDGSLYWIKCKNSFFNGTKAGTKDNTGYIRLSLNGKRYLLHTLIYIYHYGNTIGDNQVDHINRSKDDNRIENLRAVTINENNWNRNCKGYSYRTDRGNYRASITVNGQPTSLGVFKTKEEAIATYLEAKSKLHRISHKNI